MNTLKSRVLAVLFILLSLTLTLPASGQGVAWYSMQNTNWPPFPTNLFPGLNVNALGNGRYTFDDRDVDYDAVRSFSLSETSDVPAPPGDDDSGSSGGTNSTSAPLAYTTNDLWIEILGITNSQAYLRLHNTTNGEMYQLQSKQYLNRTNAAPADLLYWVPGQIVTATTNHIDYAPVPATTPTMFYRAQHGTNKLFIYAIQSATRPIATDPGSFGYFDLETSSPATLTAYYRLSGSATNGVDYTTLSGSTNFVSTDDAVVYIYPLADTYPKFEEDVILTLIPTNTYLIDTNHPKGAAALINIEENTNNYYVQLVTNLDDPVGMSYHPISNSLVVSYNADFDGNPVNFARILTNGVVTNWTGVSNLPYEIKISIVQTTTNGFTNGDMFFGTGVNGGIGWLSADGTKSNLNWLSLTNIYPPETTLRGGLYIDRGGVFSNNLIVVTGDQSDADGGGVWQIASPTNVIHLANITNTHLEGVVTTPNDTNFYGPWAGKIITGAEAITPPLIYSIDTNGFVTSYSLDIQPEDFHIIQTNQDFYVNDNDEDGGRIFKLPRNLLTNHIGDILITQAGEFSVSGHTAKLYIIHWDPISQALVRFGIFIPGAADLEHGSFAPINIPATIIPIP